MKPIHVPALAALLLLAAACASGPATGPTGGGPGAVWIDVTLKQPLMAQAKDPSQVWFVRIGGLNGSPCLPREAAFPAADGPDPTCGHDAAGNPVWQPAFLKADRIEGGRAYLDDPPPARYVAVAAVFPAIKGGTVTLYFPRDLIARTEMPAPAGEQRFMGAYRLRFGDWPFLDPAQTFVRSNVRPEAAPVRNPAAGLLGGLVKSEKGSHNKDRPARWDVIRPPSPKAEGAGLPW